MSGVRLKLSIIDFATITCVSYNIIQLNDRRSLELNLKTVSVFLYQSDFDTHHKIKRIENLSLFVNYTLAKVVHFSFNLLSFS